MEFSTKDVNFPWREKCGKWTKKGIEKYLINSIFNSVRTGGLLLIDMIARIEFERLRTQREYERSAEPNERRILFDTLLKYDFKVVSLLKTAGIMSRKVLLKEKSTSEVEEKNDTQPSNPSNISRFRPPA